MPQFRQVFSVLLGVVLLFAGHIEAQQVNQPAPPPQESAQDPGDAELTVQEVGGRLVVSGGTVVVTADPEPPRDSSVATKVDTLLLETPRSISIIDRAMLDDLGAISLTTAHDYAVGVTLLDERGPALARGFPVDFYDLRRDGLRTYSWSVRETVALDRVQYLRGPSAVLYGDGSPGALVNMVLKKPLPVPRYEIGVSGGGLGFGRITADLTGPLTASRRVRYRLAAASEWLDHGFDNGERRITLFPTIAVDVGTRGRRRCTRPRAIRRSTATSTFKLWPRSRPTTGRPFGSSTTKSARGTNTSPTPLRPPTFKPAVSIIAS
jgi:outer membrane receptor protein involved in Fe transport